MPGKIIRLTGRVPRCPLCHDMMEKSYVVERRIFVYKCDKDLVAISCDDPFVNRWDEAHAKAGKIECPVCNATDTRYFCTSTGFMKMKCVKKSCGATLSNAEPDRDKKTITATPENPGLLQ
jgi:hypothetical protein